MVLASRDGQNSLPEGRSRWSWWYRQDSGGTAFRLLGQEDRPDMLSAIVLRMGEVLSSKYSKCRYAWRRRCPRWKYGSSRHPRRRTDTFCMYKATEPGTLLALFSSPDKPYDLGDAGLIIKCHGATAWCRPCYAPASTEDRRLVQSSRDGRCGQWPHRTHDRVFEDTAGATPTGSSFAHRTAGGHGANGQWRSRWVFGGVTGCVFDCGRDGVRCRCYDDF
ncbi:hypothetical protein PG987_004865 [Apiospora arundinis]